MSNLKEFKISKLPAPPSFLKLLGPSFIILGLGLGSGEIILWPYLVSNYGLGIIWGAILGITFQFFINMEIERYALIRGESIFVGFTRLSSLLPYWFIVSTFVGFGWPGIVASSAKIIASMLGVANFQIIAIILLVLIGCVLTLGPVLYKTVERFQKTIILIGVPSIFIIAILLASKQNYIDLLKGTVGIGNGYVLFPQGLSMLTFLAAFAFSGAGGNLNLSQSFYVKEKGYGMGKYTHKIKSLFTSTSQEIDLEGTTFEENDENITNFNKWWKLINIEHFIIFLLTGTLTILLLALLAYSTTYSNPGNEAGINFIINEAQVIGENLFPAMTVVFLGLTGLMLFATQFAVLDSTSRIISENVILARPTKSGAGNIPKAYYFTLWAQVIFGISIFIIGFSDPRVLLTLSAVINAVAMFIHIGLTFLLNTKTLPTTLKPSLVRQAIIGIIFIFFGTFSAYSILGNLF
ncbi:MAG: Nramp family divalent metal transporter [Patescibacteria group bacterium]